MNLIIGSIILPFLQDRSTWLEQSMRRKFNELREADQAMTTSTRPSALIGPRLVIPQGVHFIM